MSNGKFQLLETFRRTFAGTVYQHRDSTVGNKIGRQLFEDLLTHDVSARYTQHVSAGHGVVNRAGKIHTPKRGLGRYGARQARKLGLKASQVEQLIEEYRKTR